MIGIVTDTGLAHDPVRHGPVQVVTAQRRIAAGGEHLEDAAPQTQNGNVEGPATQIIDRMDPFGGLVEPIGHGRRGGLVEQTEHLEPGQARRVFGRLALRLVEIGGNRDHETGKFPAQRRLGPPPQHLQNLCGDLDRADVPGPRAQAGHGLIAIDEVIGETPAQVLDVANAAPDHALGGGDRVQRIIHGGGLGLIAHDDGAVDVADDRGQQVPTLPVREGFGPAATHDGHQGIGGSKVDARRQAVLMRGGGATGLRDLQQCHAVSRSVHRGVFEGSFPQRASSRRASACSASVRHL